MFYSCTHYRVTPNSLSITFVSEMDGLIQNVGKLAPGPFYNHVVVMWKLREAGWK